MSLACYFNHAFGVGPAVPASVTNFKGFLAWAKANPDKANYGSPAAGSMPHMIAALASLLSSVPLKHIPYRGSAPGIQDLLGGQIASMSSPIGDYLPYIKTGKLRVLAISGTTRSTFVPDVPTFREHGLPITVREWYGLFLPAKANAQTAMRAAAYVQTALAQHGRRHQHGPVRHGGAALHAAGPRGPAEGRRRRMAPADQADRLYCRILTFNFQNKRRPP